MRARSLERRDRLVRSPDEQPVPCVRDVALVASEPISSERVHVVPTPQLVKGGRIVAADELDYLFQRSEVYMAPVQTFHVSRECRGEVRL